MQVRVALRASVCLPRLVWGGDSNDEGHHKLLASELLESRPFIPDHGGVQDGFCCIGAAVPNRRLVPGFSMRGLVKIVKRMKLNKKPKYSTDLDEMEDVNGSGVEVEVIVSDCSDDSTAGYSSSFSLNASGSSLYRNHDERIRADRRAVADIREKARGGGQG